MRLKARCKMQDNGFAEAEGRGLTLAECRERFKCEDDGPLTCGECTMFSVTRSDDDGQRRNDRA